MRKNISQIEEAYHMIKAFTFDIDGVATEGGVLCLSDGDLLRTFSSHDCQALRQASMKGYHLGINTGGHSESIARRFVGCGVKEDDIIVASNRKIDAFRHFCAKYSLDPSKVVYIGDDIPDIPVLEACGLSVCPWDAMDEVKDVVDIISPRPGGRGCIRHIVETVMRVQGTWVFDVDRYAECFKAGSYQADAYALEHSL